MREDLLGYLLGALDAADRERIEQRLERDPWLREQLEFLQAQLEPLESARETEDELEFEPPLGLAERTADFVTDFEDRYGVQPASRLSPTPPLATAARSWSWTELAVCAGAFLTSAMLFFPAIAQSRYQAQITYCQNNLRQLSQSIETYAMHMPDQRLPYVPVEGPEAFAGYVAVALNETELVADPHLLLCPASETADRVRETGRSFRVPTRKDLLRAAPDTLVHLQRWAGGSFGFNVGYIVNGRHWAARHDASPYFAIAADSPSLTLPDNRTANHGGRGQNILYSDGHVRFVVGCPGNHCIDHPFRNNRGLVEAGIGQNDSVVAPSISPPLIRLISDNR